MFYLAKPAETDMYSSWQRVRGDATHSGEGSIIVWAARNPGLMAELFSGDPVATIPVRT